MLVATDDPCLVLQWFDALPNEELKITWPHEAHRRLLPAASTRAATAFIGDDAK